MISVIGHSGGSQVRGGSIRDGKGGVGRGGGLSHSFAKSNLSRAIRESKTSGRARGQRSPHGTQLIHPGGRLLWEGNGASRVSTLVTEGPCQRPGLKVPLPRHLPFSTS